MRLLVAGSLTLLWQAQRKKVDNLHTGENNRSHFLCRAIGIRDPNDLVLKSTVVTISLEPSMGFILSRLKQY